MKPPVLVLCVGACLASLIVGLFVGGQETKEAIRLNLSTMAATQNAYEDIKSNVEDVRSSLEDLKAKKGDLKTLEKSLEAVELCVDDLGSAVNRNRYY